MEILLGIGVTHAALAKTGKAYIRSVEDHKSPINNPPQVKGPAPKKPAKKRNES